MHIAVIGLGSMGRRRVRLLQKKYGEIVLLGIDKNRKRCQQCFKELGIETSENLEDIKKYAGIEAVFVCTSPITHAGIIGYCLEAGYHVFTELNLVADDYEKNMELAKKNHKLLFLSSTALYRREMCYIINQVKETKSDVIYNYHVGQYLPDWHPWENYKDFFVGDKRTNGCRELLAIELPWIQKAFGKVTDMNVVRRKNTDLPIDYEDTYLIQFIHENKTAGNLIVDVVSREAVRKLEVLSEVLYIRWDGVPDSLEHKNMETKEMEKVALYNQIEHEEGYSNTIIENQYVDEIQEFMECMQSGKKPEYGFFEDMETLRLIDWIEKN